MDDRSLTKRNYKLAAVLIFIVIVMLAASMLLTRVFVLGS
jgi:hypothetical protein